MMCPRQAGFVPKYSQKLTTLGIVLGYWQLQRRSCPSCQKCGTRLFGAFDLLEDSLRGWGLVREDLGFPGQAGVSWRFQVNIAMPIFSLENGQTPSDQALKENSSSTLSFFML